MNAKSHLLETLLLTIFALGQRLNAAPGYAEGELLVKWKDGPESYAAALGNAQIGSAVIRNLDQIGWQLVALPEHLGIGEAVDLYRNLQGVIAVEPNAALRIETPIQTESTAPLQQLSAQPSIPNDPRSSSQWYLRKIGTPAAWQTTTGSTNIVVALIDTGVDYTHPDLAAPLTTRSPNQNLIIDDLSL